MLSILKKLTIFIVFLLIIGAFLGPKVMHTDDITKAGAVERRAYSISMSIQIYYHELNEFPQGTSEEICEALMGKNPSQEPFIIRKQCPIDPWDMPYDIHVSPNGEIKIISAGENQIFGDKDDYVFEDKIEVTTPAEEKVTSTQENTEGI